MLLFVNFIFGRTAQHAAFIVMILFFAYPLQAGPSASHTIRIIIRRPNLITIDANAQPESGLTGDMDAQSAFRLRWQTDLQKKRLTVSSVHDANGEQSILVNQKKKIRLSTTPQEVSDTLNNRKGECTIQFEGNPKVSKPVKLVYTLTDE